MELDEGEKKAIEFLQKKFDPRRIMALAARYAKLSEDEYLRNAILISGWIQHKSVESAVGTGSIADWEVALETHSGKILKWRTWKRETK